MGSEELGLGMPMPGGPSNGGMSIGGMNGGIPIGGIGSGIPMGGGQPSNGGGGPLSPGDALLALRSPEESGGK